MLSSHMKILKLYIPENAISDAAIGLITNALVALLHSQEISIDNIKSTAKLLKVELKKYGVTVNHTQCLQIVSMLLGYKNWHVASAMLKKGAI
jgi:hypothetical protein